MKRAILPVLICALLPASLDATATSSADLAWLTNNSTAIVVGTVNQASFTRSGLHLSVVVSRSLRGTLTEGSTAAVVASDATAGDDVDALGASALWFLRDGGDLGAWTLLPVTEGPFSVESGLLRVPPGALPAAYTYAAEDAVIDKVISEVRAASDGPVEIASSAYDALLTLTTPSALVGYRHAAQLGEAHFATCAMGRFLSTWERSLTQRIAAYAQANQVVPVSLAKNLCRVADVAVVSEIATVLGSASVGVAARRCAAQSLRNIHSAAALPHLRNLLENPDREMQYMGLAGLALNANNVLPGQSMWRSTSHRGGASTDATMSNFASYSAFIAAPDGYLSFWRNWYPNLAPNVSGVSGGGATCHPPAPWKSCTLPVTAATTDANGDPRYFKWSTCSPALEGATNCNVNTLGPNTATLEVGDGRGGTASSSVVLYGVNQTPTYSHFEFDQSAPMPADTDGAVTFYVVDDDLDAYGCHATAMGACTLLGFACVGQQVTVEFRTRPPAGPVGLCHIKYVKWTDAWGASANETASIEVVP